MDEVMSRALAAGARAFADVLDQELQPQSVRAPDKPVAGSADSMYEVLSSVARINDNERRGVTDDESRSISARAGMDNRGMAGYYNAGLLVMRPDGRWITDVGRERLGRLHGHD